MGQSKESIDILWKRDWNFLLTDPFLWNIGNIALQLQFTLLTNFLHQVFPSSFSIPSLIQAAAYVSLPGVWLYLFSIHNTLQHAQTLVQKSIMRKIYISKYVGFHKIHFPYPTMFPSEATPSSQYLTMSQSTYFPTMLTTYVLPEGNSNSVVTPSIN